MKTIEYYKKQYFDAFRCGQNNKKYGFTYIPDYEKEEMIAYMYGYKNPDM